jgi:aminoglycoside phosphotransferase (APT) family kinase protein
MHTQGNLMAAGKPVGVAVAGIIAISAADADTGWVVMDRVEGTALPSEVFGLVGGESPSVARAAGFQMARIHAMPKDLLKPPTQDPLTQMVGLVDMMGPGHPAFELGLKWLEANQGDLAGDVVVHGDFRFGNLLVGRPDGKPDITAVLDWELAHRGCGAEDLGWFCVRSWRFGGEGRAGGLGTVEDLRAGYAEGGGGPPEASEILWWEAYGTLRWGLICLLQANTHLSGRYRSVELASIGRRSLECAEDLLEIVQGPSDYVPPSPESPSAENGNRDRQGEIPTADDLLEAVVEHLERMRETLRGADRYQMRVATNALAVVRRETAANPRLENDRRRRWDELGVDGDTDLAHQIRSGAIDAGDETLNRLVRESVRDALAVANPRHLSR